LADYPKTNVVHSNVETPAPVAPAELCSEPTRWTSKDWLRIALISGPRPAEDEVWSPADVIVCSMVR